MYVLIDGNSFFVSCELVRCPYYKDRPVVVRSNGDGCIIAANKIAKALPGFEMWKPVFKQKEILEKYKVIQFSPNFELYVDTSRKMMATIRDFLPNLQVYSIDECFCEFNIQGADYKEYADKIRHTVYKHVGIPTGIGIAPTITLTKVANHIAKKFTHILNGVYVIDTEEKRIKALKWLDISDVWGIGKKHALRLRSVNVNTAYDFTQLPDNWIRKYMSVVGLRMKHELLGVSCLSLEEINPPKKEIGTAKQFGKMLSDYDTIREVTANYVTYCAEKLRRQKSLSNAILLFLATNPFNEREEQYYPSMVMTLPYSTSETSVLIKYATKALNMIFKEGLKYRRVGISLIGIVPDDTIQGNLFVPNNPKNNVIQKVIDTINFKYGIDTVRSATAGYSRNEWETRFDNRSPRFTTRLNESLKIGKSLIS